MYAKVSLKISERSHHLEMLRIRTWNLQVTDLENLFLPNSLPDFKVFCSYLQRICKPRWMGNFENQLS